MSLQNMVQLWLEIMFILLWVLTVLTSRFENQNSAMLRSASLTSICINTENHQLEGAKGAEENPSTGTLSETIK
jgi:hypothetical protein